MVTTKNAAGTTLFYTVRNYADGDGDDQTTNRVSGYACRNGNGGILNYNTYAYDEAGNIIQISQVLSNGSRVLARYSYDCQNQLTQEIRYSYSGSSLTGTATTINYTYDTAGNLLGSYADGATWVTYAYADDDWADLLTSVNVNGTSQTISYDGGNPTNWYNGSSYSGLTWQQGRRLASLSKGSTSVSYTYDIEGIRTSKTVGSTKYEYVTQNGKVVREYVSNASTGAFIRCLDFFYDTNGQPFALRKYRDATLTGYDTYHYVLNAQGDVVQINYQGGTVYATYTYDAWGRVLTSTGSLSGINPLRYRGYYYDTETGFYYLQSRYYDPIIKRFLNADSYASTGQGFLGYNMFAYCNNCPTLYCDNYGTKLEVTIFNTGIDEVFEKVRVLVLLAQISDDTLAFEGNTVVIVKECANPSHPIGTELVRSIIYDENVVDLRLFNQGMWSATYPDPGSATDRRGSTIELNKTQAQEITKFHTTTALILAHEMIHAYHNLRGANIPEQDKENLTVGLGKYARERITENGIRRERGIELRTLY